MENDYNEKFKDFLYELKDNALVNLRDNDNHYNSLIDMTVSLTDKKLYDDITFRNVNKLSETYNEISSIEHDTLYYQGYLDCITLLKKLGCI